MKIINVVGARPNFMKMAPILKVMSSYPRLNPILVHTGQHYDVTMSRAFFEDLELPEPDIYLGVGSGSHAAQTARIMVEFEKVLEQEKPNLIVVVGDVNSTLACSVVAAKLLVPIAHVEAGLRSFDRTMPEEINRVVTDALSEYLFTTSEDANLNLKREGIPEEKIFFVGNVMIDSLLQHLEKAKRTHILKKLGLIQKNLKTAPMVENLLDYAVLTLHRPSNVDDPEVFLRIIQALTGVSQHLPIIFPVHPRTRKQIAAFGYQSFFKDLETTSVESTKGFIGMIEPLGYLDFLGLMSRAKFILTDSGGLQEETTALGIPCLTLRENTERPVTITEGTNTLVGTDPEKIIFESQKILRGEGKAGRIPKLWDGKTAERIVKILSEL
ncbi:MAG TPA: UDP-N-acetylglucosamine 2-epimerase (non-hydrolyzing) [Candidatus Limnocylindrales bacterium]|nr:UDP-N-acetylglucosamine 2-epimerase (non-hydrolyzing) [Candidatus Limnocylindrales bacterium]